MRSHKRIFGRDTEVEKILCDIQTSDNSVNLISGEKGIGTSALLDELCDSIDSSMKDVIASYYNHNKSFKSPPTYTIQPFLVVLSELIGKLKESEYFVKGSTTKRLKNAVRAFVKEDGSDLAKDIAKELASKFGLGNIVEPSWKFWKTLWQEQTSVSIAEQYLRKYLRLDPQFTYLRVMEKLVEEFKNLKFVFIFDNFQYLDYKEISFLVDFVDKMPKRIHIIVSYTTEDWLWHSDLSKKGNYDTMKNHLNGVKTHPLRGLEIKDIRDWIYAAKGKEFGIDELKNIRNKSGGFPQLLATWMDTCEDLNPDNINKDIICKELVGSVKKLRDDEQWAVYKMAILFQQPTNRTLSKYLKKFRIDHPTVLFNSLSSKEIFDSQTKWFRNDILQECCKDELWSPDRIKCHKQAANFFLELMKDEDRKSKEKFTNLFDRRDDLNHLERSYAYHLHTAETDIRESMVEDKKQADRASKRGDLRIADTFYNMAVENSEKLEEEDFKMKCIDHLTRSVYPKWERDKDSLSNFEKLIDYHAKINDKKMIISLIQSIGSIHLRNGEYEKALERYSNSLEKIGSTDKRELAMTWNHIAFVLFKNGDLNGSFIVWNIVARVFLSLNRLPELVGVLGQIAHLSELKGDFDNAIETYHNCKRGYDLLGNKLAKAYSLNNIGMVYRMKSKYDDSILNYRKALSIFEELEDLDGIAKVLNNMGGVYFDKKNYDEAIKKFEKSLIMKDRLGDRYGMIVTLNNLIEIYLVEGKFEEALNSCLRLDDELKKIGFSKEKRSSIILSRFKNRLVDEQYRDFPTDLAYALDEKEEA